MTVNVVILGSISKGPYNVLVPHPFDRLKFYGSPAEHEEAYQLACRTFYPAINNADFVYVYSPDGPLRPGSHTQRDVDYALAHGKTPIYMSDPGFWGRLAASNGQRADDAEDKVKVLREILVKCSDDPRYWWPSGSGSLSGSFKAHEFVAACLKVIDGSSAPGEDPAYAGRRAG